MFLLLALGRREGGGRRKEEEEEEVVDIVSIIRIRTFAPWMVSST